MFVCKLFLLLLFSFSAGAMEQAKAPSLIKKNSYYRNSLRPPAPLNDKGREKRIAEAKKALARATRDNDVKAVKGLMSRDISDEIQKNSKKDFVEIARKNNADDQIIRLLFDNEPHVKHAYRHLCRAIKNNQISLLNIILKSKISQKILNCRYMKSPLAIAIKEGNKNVVKLLLDAGAPVNAPTFDVHDNYVRQRSSLGTALQQKTVNEDIIKLLFDAGAKLNRETEEFLLARHQEHMKKVITL